MKYEIRNGLSIDDKDVVDFDSFIPAGEFNPHHVHPFVLHDHGTVLAVVFASNLQDALDAAVDANKLDQFQIPEGDPRLGTEDEDGVARLGNAGEPFDIESVEAVELTNPPMSFCALLDASAVGSRVICTSPCVDNSCPLHGIAAKRAK